MYYESVVYMGHYQQHGRKPHSSVKGIETFSGPLILNIDKVFSAVR